MRFEHLDSDPRNLCFEAPIGHASTTCAPACCAQVHYVQLLRLANTPQATQMMLMHPSNRVTRAVASLSRAYLWCLRMWTRYANWLGGAVCSSRGASRGATICCQPTGGNRENAFACDQFCAKDRHGLCFGSICIKHATRHHSGAI